MLEKQFENSIKKYLKSQGAYFVKYFGCAFSQSGVPDVLCCYKGHFIAIELKGDKGRASPLQIHNLKQIDAAGGFALLLYPKDYEAFTSFIDAVTDGNDRRLAKLYAGFRSRFLKQA